MSPGGQPRRETLRCFRKLGTPGGATRGDAEILCAYSLPPVFPFRSSESCLGQGNDSQASDQPDVAGRDVI